MAKATTFWDNATACAYMRLTPQPEWPCAVSPASTCLCDRIRAPSSGRLFCCAGTVSNSRTAVGQRLALGLAFAAKHDLAGRIALRPLDGDGAIAEVLVLEDAADRHAVPGQFFKVAKQARDVLNVGRAELLALAAQALTHLLPEAA